MGMLGVNGLPLAISDYTTTPEAKDQAGSAAHFDSTQRGALFAIPPEQPEQPEQPEKPEQPELRSLQDPHTPQLTPCPVIGVVCPSSSYWIDRGGCPYGYYFEASPQCIETFFGRHLPSSWTTTVFNVRWCRQPICHDRKIRMWNNGHWLRWTGNVSRDGWKGRIEPFNDGLPGQWAVGDTLTITNYDLCGGSYHCS